MQLYQIRGGNKEDLEAKKYNIAVGVSLGNKWFTVENICEQIRWALLYTREQTVVYVADTIHAINLEVRNKISYERALRIAKRRGEEILRNVEKIVLETFTPEDIAKISYATWDDVANQKYKTKVQYLYDLYELNNEFSDLIKSIVREWVSKEDKAFSDEEIERLSAYILEELPEIMGRVTIGGVIYEAYTYPFGGELAELTDKLQQGKIFPEVRQNILDTEPKVFLEVR